MMTQAIENSLILTYKWIRKHTNTWFLNPGTARELAGVFINFLVREDPTYQRGEIDTRFFDIKLSSDGFAIIKLQKERSYYYTNNATTKIKEELAQLTEGDFHTLWLRSSFESPGDYSLSNDVLQETKIEIAYIMRPFYESQYERKRQGEEDISVLSLEDLEVRSHFHLY